MGRRVGTRPCGQLGLLGTADPDRPLPLALLCGAEWEDDIGKLCSAMPFMTGCSFWVQCTVSLWRWVGGSGVDPHSLQGAARQRQLGVCATSDALCHAAGRTDGRLAAHATQPACTSCRCCTGWQRQRHLLRAVCDCGHPVCGDAWHEGASGVSAGGLLPVQRCRASLCVFMCVT